MATTIGTITDGSIVSEEWQGTGVFDALMNAVNKNIEIQFNKGRIAGPDYANVYLGGIQAVLQQSIAFALQKDTSDAQSAEILDSTTRANTQLQDQLLTATKQRLGIDKDIDVKERSTVIQENQSIQDILNKQSQKAILDQQKLTEVQNTAKAAYEVVTLLPDQHNTNIKQLEAIDKDIEAKNQQILNMQDELFTANKQRDLIDKQLLKAKVDNRISLNGLNASNIDMLNKSTREVLPDLTYTVDNLADIDSSEI